MQLVSCTTLTQAGSDLKLSLCDSVFNMLALICNPMLYSEYKRNSSRLVCI